MGTRLHVNLKRVLGTRNPMIYGHFIEHFHRQIYGGVYDPGNSLSDESGLRMDVLDAMRKIRVPVLRWPGGCFVSSYHWKYGVGKERIPMYDKAWAVEDPNTFGTDEYVDMCRKIGCEPYICANAGTGTPEEISDWVEYCNLKQEGQFAKWRIANGHEAPHQVKYWSIGNENWGEWELGAKTAEEWGYFVRETGKMIKHVDKDTELTAAALPDLDWNTQLLRIGGKFLDWISIHQYWDPINGTNDFASYEQVMAYTNLTENGIREVRGLLTAMRLEKKIKIAFDEWNLRGWYHPDATKRGPGETREDYVKLRDKNDINSLYTMADALFTACFLNTCNRNCDIVGMANFAPIVNTRGCIFTYPDGIVLRSTYHVFDLYVNCLGDVILDSWEEDAGYMTVRNRAGELEETAELDILATAFQDKPGVAIAIVNKNASSEKELALCFDDDSVKEGAAVILHYICGDSTEAYNDIGHEGVPLCKENLGTYRKGMKIILKPHMVGVLQIGVES